MLRHHDVMMTRLIICFGNLAQNIYLGEFDKLDNLKELELDNNGVEFIGKMVFRNMKSLEKLSIKQSHIATLRDDFHFGLESLSHITYNFGGIQASYEQMIIEYRHQILLEIC